MGAPRSRLEVGVSVVILETSGTIEASETAQHRCVPVHVDVRDPVW